MPSDPWGEYRANLAALPKSEPPAPEVSAEFRTKAETFLAELNSLQARYGMSAHDCDDCCGGERIEEHAQQPRKLGDPEPLRVSVRFDWDSYRWALEE